MTNSKHITPRILMLIDGIGAMISTILLGVVLVELEQYVGMPSEVLTH
ncbi:MAG: hypothetical protein RIC80_00180 [Cyclobacteriaceae bacterium]